MHAAFEGEHLIGFEFCGGLQPTPVSIWDPNADWDRFGTYQVITLHRDRFGILGKIFQLMEKLPFDVSHP